MHSFLYYAYTDEAATVKPNDKIMFFAKETTAFIYGSVYTLRRAPRKPPGFSIADRFVFKNLMPAVSFF